MRQLRCWQRRAAQICSSRVSTPGECSAPHRENGACPVRSAARRHRPSEPVVDRRVDGQDASAGVDGVVLLRVDSGPGVGVRSLGVLVGLVGRRRWEWRRPAGATAARYRPRRILVARCRTVARADPGPRSSQAPVVAAEDSPGASASSRPEDRRIAAPPLAAGCGGGPTGAFARRWPHAALATGLELCAEWVEKRVTLWGSAIVSALLATSLAIDTTCGRDGGSAPRAGGLDRRREEVERGLPAAHRTAGLPARPSTAQTGARARAGDGRAAARRAPDPHAARRPAHWLGPRGLRGGPRRSRRCLDLARHALASHRSRSASRPRARYTPGGSLAPSGRQHRCRYKEVSLKSITVGAKEPARFQRGSRSVRS